MAIEINGGVNDQSATTAFTKNEATIAYFVARQDSLGFLVIIQVPKHKPFWPLQTPHRHRFV